MRLNNENKNRMSSQAELILADLQKGQTITPLDALRRYGCLRLAARIDDLRREGYTIETRMRRSGRKHWAEYSLARGQLELVLPLGP